MNINQMRQFAAVAKYKSITRAAQEIYVSQQALSKSIKLLQKEMGGELFQSRGQGLQLTDLGNKLLAIVEALLPRYDSCMDMVAQLIEQNKKRIAISFEHGFLQYVVPTELMMHSAVSIHIAADIAVCQTEVAECRADLGVCAPPSTLREGLRYVPLVREPPMLLMREQHPLAGREKLTLRELKDYPQAMPSLHSDILNGYINACIDEGFFPNFVMESRDFGLLLRSLMVDDLLLLCPSFAVEKSMAGMVLLPLEREGLWTETGVILREDNHAPRVIDFMGKLLAHYSAK